MTPLPPTATGWGPLLWFAALAFGLSWLGWAPHLLGALALVRARGCELGTLRP